MSSQATVYLVGAGPGDPGLLTLRGAECLARAEVVVYDALVNPLLLRHAPSAEHIFAGKKSGGHSLPQPDINAILIAQARAGKRTVRLKGGDPFVFGRGGEEALALVEAGIPFEVVPGVTAGIAAPAYFGVPVTHRGLSSSVSLITAHATADGGASASAPPDLARLAAQGTLVFYMGLANLGAVVEQLLALGRAPETPAALISSGTFAHQHMLRATLSTIVDAAAQDRPESPVLLVVGEVLGLAPQLAWFGKGNLAGLRAVVTHAPGTDPALENLLRGSGADVLHFPLLSFTAPPVPLPEIDCAAFDWIVFSSPNAAEQLFAGLHRLGLDARRLARAKFCAIGRRTAHAVEQQRLLVDVQPHGFEPSAVIDAMNAVASLQGARVLIPRADIGRSALPEALRAAGAETVELVAYHTETAAIPEVALERFTAFAPQLIAFTNSNAARAFAQQVWPQLTDATRAALQVAVIGPVTAAAARNAGLPVHLEPAEHDTRHLFEAICEWAALKGR